MKRPGREIIKWPDDLLRSREMKLGNKGETRDIFQYNMFKDYTLIRKT